jgi:uncharacterized membrane protein YqjE
LGFGGIGTIIVGIIALIVIIAIIVFLVQLLAPVIVGLIILAIIVGVGLWNIRKNQANNIIISATKTSSHQFDMILLLAASERTENIPMSNPKVKL